MNLILGSLSGVVYDSLCLMPSKRRGNKGRANASSLANVMRKVGVDPNHLPSFKSAIRFKHQFRFSFSSAGANTTTFGLFRAYLLNLLFVNRASSTTNARVIAGIKLNRVEMRYFTAPAGSTVVVSQAISVEWLSNNGPATEISDNAIGVSPAKITTSPPAKSLAAFWSLSGVNESEQLCTFRYPAAGTAFIDIWCDIVLMDDEVPVSITTTNSGTASQLYVAPLDGVPQGTPSWPPVSYSTLS